MCSEYVGDFNLSVTRALRDQLLDRLEALAPAGLTEANLATLARRGGVYQLFHHGALVYIGKSTRNLPARLEQHRRKLSGRRGGLIAEVTFRCVYVDEDLDALAPEKMLIGTFRKRQEAEWNNNGFGNKDPGRQRDTSLVESSHFDYRYPIDLEYEIELSDDDGENLATLMRALKRELPYNFRYEDSKPVRAELAQIPVDASEVLGSNRAPASDWLDIVASYLPEGWSIVALPGYLIAYPGFEVDRCASRTGHWRSGAGGASRWHTHHPEASDGVVAVDDPV